MVWPSGESTWSLLRSRYLPVSILPGAPVPSAARRQSSPPALMIRDVPSGVQLGASMTSSASSSTRRSLPSLATVTSCEICPGRRLRPRRAKPGFEVLEDIGSGSGHRGWTGAFTPGGGGGRPRPPAGIGRGSGSAENLVVLILEFLDRLVRGLALVAPELEHHVPDRADPVGIGDVEGVLHRHVRLGERIEHDLVAHIERRRIDVRANGGRALL